MPLTRPEDRHPEGPRASAEGTGFSPGIGLHVVVPGAAVERPPRPAWITDAFLARTVEVWSVAYGRSINEDEAREILMNVGRLAEVLVDAKREMQR